MSHTTRRTNPEELRQIFNERQLAERAAAGSLLQILEREAPARVEANQPPGTMSRMVWYVDEQLNKVALVHEYRLPDGTLGGSGRPDPKRLLVDGEILFC